jgi:cytoskeletal protein CcmA (bactofilin family)
MATKRDFVVKKGLVVTEGVTAASLDISGDVDIDGTLEADAITLNGTSLATSATTDTTNASNIGSGTLATGRLAAALTAQTSILNTSLVVGRDSTDQIKFSTNDQIIFRVGNADGVVFKASGEIEATSLDISGDVDVDGTLEADAITVNGSALASSATTDTTNASNIGSGTLATGRLAAALTAQTSMLNTSLVVGRDADNQIKFSTDNQMIFRVGAGDGVTFKASGEIEATSLDISGDVDVDGTLEADAITLGGTAVAVSGGAFHDGFSDFVANEHIDHSGVSITAGDGLTGGGDITSTRTLNVVGGDGITANANDIAITAAQTTITSVLNASLAVGRDAHNQIKFSTDDQIIFRVGNADGVTFKASGEIEATKFDGALEGNADTATALASSVNINGVAFDGSSDITVTAAGSTLSDTVTVAKGGTGQTSYTNGQLLIGNTTGNTLTKATLTAGSGISITNGTGSITIAATGSGGIASLAADSTPQLGGDLDVNGNEIVSTSNADIGITPNGTGRVIIGSTTSQHDNLSKLTIKGSDAGLLIEKHDDGSSGGPTLALYRYSASVADSDLIGQVNFRGEGSTGNPSTYIALRTEIEDTTEGTKDGKLIVRGLKNNTQTEFMSVGSTGVKINDSYTLPTSDGSNGQVLQTNGSGTLSFASAGGASSLNDLTDVISNTTNFTDSILISPDGAAPPQGGTLSSATDNIGIGKDVFSAGMTSGHSNVAIGTEAGKSVTNSHEAVYIGHHAGKSITYGEDNVCVGAYTIDNGAGASANVAVGWSVLTALTGGGSNTGIGYNAGSTVSNHTNNVFVGRDAGKDLNSSYNVIVGSQAGDGIASGGNNVLIGYQAGGNMSGAADSNICIGYLAGDNITTGDNNLVIGGADVDTATGDDQISISSGDGGVTWLKGDSNGIKALKIKVKSVSGNTTLTDAQSGSYVYWTAGTLTLPATAESGQQYTIINNTGGSATPSLGTSNAIASGWTSHAAMADETARTYVAVAANTWIYIG